MKRVECTGQPTNQCMLVHSPLSSASGLGPKQEESTMMIARIPTFHCLLLLGLLLVQSNFSLAQTEERRLARKHQSYTYVDRQQPKVISFDRLRLIDWYQRMSVRPPLSKRPTSYLQQQQVECPSRAKKRHRWASECHGKGTTYHEAKKHIANAGKGLVVAQKHNKNEGKGKTKHGGKQYKKSAAKHVFYGYDSPSSKKGRKKTEGVGKGPPPKKGKGQGDRNIPFHFFFPPPGPSPTVIPPTGFSLPTPAMPPLIVPLLGPTAAPIIAVHDEPITFPVGPGASPSYRPSGSPVVVTTSTPLASPRFLTFSPTGAILRTPVPFSNSPTRSSPVVSPVTEAPSSASPTYRPTTSPVAAPVTQTPSRAPTSRPTLQPTTTPLTGSPSLSPTTDSPSVSPTTISPTVPRNFEPADTTSTPSATGADGMGRSPISVPPTSTNPTTRPTSSPTRLPTETPTTVAPVSQSPTRAPSTSPAASPETNSPTRKVTVAPSSAPTASPSKSPVKSPVTEIPTSTPTTLQETIEPTISIEGIVVAATQFEVDYDEFVADASEFPAAEEVTLTYLREFMESQFEFNVRTTLNGFRGNLVASNAADSVATYEISLIFDPSSIGTPTTAEVDLLVFAALNEPFVPTLIAALNALPANNSFSQTNTVTYTPKGRRLLRQLS